MQSTTSVSSAQDDTSQNGNASFTRNFEADPRAMQLARVHRVAKQLHRLSIITFEKLTNPAHDLGAIVRLSQALSGPIRFGTFNCAMLLTSVNQHLGIVKGELRMTLEAHCAPVGIGKYR